MFGRPIGKNQGIAFPLAEAHAQLHAADARWSARPAGAIDHGLPCGEEANIAKYLAAEAGFFAADRAVQTHGGFGYATEYHVERYWREARLHAHRPDQPGDGPQLRRRARPRPAPQPLAQSGQAPSDFRLSDRPDDRTMYAARLEHATHVIRSAHDAATELGGEAEALDVDALVVAVEAAAELGRRRATG